MKSETPSRFSTVNSRCFLLSKRTASHITNWLVVSTPLKNISQLGWLFPIYWKIKNVPNHQPANAASATSEIPQGDNTISCLNLYIPLECPASLVPQLRQVRVDSIPSMVWVKWTLCKRGCPHPVLPVLAPGQGREARTSKSDNKRYCFNTLRHAVQREPWLHPNMPTKAFRFSLTENVVGC